MRGVASLKNSRLAGEASLTALAGRQAATKTRTVGLPQTRCSLCRFMLKGAAKLPQKIEVKTMRRNISRQSLITCALIFVCLILVQSVSAQPTDAQTTKDVSGRKTVSVTLGKPGKVEWSSTYKKYVWTRNFTARLTTDEPGIFVIVKGYASYDVMGGRYVFWRTFITSNNYEGIPDPSAADVQALIRKFGVEQFLGNYYFNRIIGQLESIGLADEPKYEWHTPNSVSFNVVAIYTEKTNDVGGKERVARTLRIRLYRDSPKVEWRNLMSTPEEKKVL